MAIQNRLTSEELQSYYNTAEGISLMPGWVDGEGERPPEIKPFSGAGPKSSLWY